MIVGLIKPNEGKIFLDDEEITGEPNVSPCPKRHRLPGTGGIGFS
jgi:ABC-type lipopolysaccharide export system ATPase subunit